jgi:hypothetical protein
MAEASITINDIVFVIDCGKAKETTYDALNNTPCLLPSWISQASARQASMHVLIFLYYIGDGMVIFYCFTVSRGIYNLYLIDSFFFSKEDLSSFLLLSIVFEMEIFHHYIAN